MLFTGTTFLQSDHTVSFPYLLSTPSASHSPSLLTSYSSSSMDDCFWTFTLASSDGSSWVRESEIGEEALLNRAERLAFTATQRKWKQTKERKGKDVERIVVRDEWRILKQWGLHSCSLWLKRWEAPSGSSSSTSSLCIMSLMFKRWHLQRRWSSSLKTVCHQRQSWVLQTWRENPS